MAVSLAAVTLALVALVAPVTQAQQTGDLVGDPARGKVVFRSIGYCVNCHGWAADGKTGTNLQAPVGPNLRQTQLDTAQLLETIGCGRPGTPMPYHDRAAYRDNRCYGMTMSDFAPGTEPVRGKTFSEQDVANVVAYLEADVIGLGEPTYAECADFFDNPDAYACRSMK
ncbi:MAG: c-type cytochrome [Hyphomicrobiaceae bacterium]|nr:c-type cytochrome [Hyphomicrobiaceae bacterium]